MCLGTHRHLQEAPFPDNPPVPILQTLLHRDSSCGVQVDEFIHEAASSTEQRDDDAAAVTASPQQADARQARRTAALKSASAASLPDRDGAGRRVLARSYECGPGCVVGSTDFYLARPHGTRAVCRSAVARVLRVSRSGAPGPGCRWPGLRAARSGQSCCGMRPCQAAELGICICGGLVGLLL